MDNLDKLINKIGKWGNKPLTKFERELLALSMTLSAENTRLRNMLDYQEELNQVRQLIRSN